MIIRIIGLCVLASIYFCEMAMAIESVQIEKTTDGSWHIAAPAYDLVIGADGFIRTLTSGGVSMLGTGPDGKSGAFFLDEQDHLAVLPDSAKEGDNGILCQLKGSAEVRYTFYPDRIEIVRNAPSPRFLKWAWVPSARITRSLDGEHDGTKDLAKQPFDGYQVNARWVSDAGPILFMPTIEWQHKPEVAADRNVAVLSHYFGEGDEKPFVIRPVPQPKSADAVALNIHCQDPNFMLPGGQPAGFDVDVENVTKQPVKLDVQFRVLGYLDRQPIESNRQAFVLNGSESKPLSLRAKLTEPGAYRAEISFIDGDRVARKLEWVFIYDWEHWQPVASRPADFETYWASTLEELRSQPLDPVLTPQPDQNGCKVFKVNFRSLGDHRVYGWYVVPPGAEPMPALLMLPGNGVYKMMSPYRFPFYHYALLMIQVHGYDVDLSNFPTTAPVWPANNYWADWKSRDEAFARIVYTNCVRAVDFLMSRPEVDKDSVCVDGGSQGGGLSLITAGLDHRLKAACVQFPGLCRIDWAYTHFLDAPFPWHGVDPRSNGISKEDFLHTLSYYDAANFARDVTCPVTGLVALQDKVTMGANSLAALRQIPVAPTIVNGVWVNHRSDERTNEAYIAWLKRNLSK